MGGEKLEQLCMEHEGLKLYKAGLPGFPRNFPRDSIISAWLLQHAPMMHDQLVYSAAKQGKRDNPEDGEELGKIHHEMDLHTGRGVKGSETEGLRDRPGWTTYNACDTTALFLLGHGLLYEWTDGSLALKQKRAIVDAVRYIYSHIEDGLFTERPPGTDQYCLKVTYWKDSVIAGRDEVSYPAVYPLAHAQNMQGLRSARLVLGKIHSSLDAEERDVLGRITPTVAQMRGGLHRLYDKNNRTFIIAQDAKGRIEGVSSDSLYMLAYLQRKDLPQEWTWQLERSSAEIETNIGYRGLSPEFDGMVNDSYHTDKVWPIEQATISLGAKRFRLQHVQDVSSRIIKKFFEEQHTGTHYELFAPGEEPGEWVPGGQETQLWSIAAKRYFSRALAL